jgi:thioredoxin-like negative regulator of GroEL
MRYSIKQDHKNRKKMVCYSFNSYFCGALKYFGMKVETEEQLQQLIGHSEALLVYFYSDHCPPCLSLRPKVSQMMEQDFPRMKIAFVDAEGQPGLAARHSAFSLPVLVFFFEGKEYLRFSKYVSVSELRDSVGRIYQLYYS